MDETHSTITESDVSNARYETIAQIQPTLQLLCLKVLEAQR